MAGGVPDASLKNLRYRRPAVIIGRQANGRPAIGDIGSMLWHSCREGRGVWCGFRELSVLEGLMGRGSETANGRAKAGLEPARRPTIGIALGGGAARGFAHIG